MYYIQQKRYPITEIINKQKRLSFTDNRPFFYKRI